MKNKNNKKDRGERKKFYDEMEKNLLLILKRKGLSEKEEKKMIE